VLTIDIYQTTGRLTM